jgi:type II secretory pathway component PulM
VATLLYRKRQRTNKKIQKQRGKESSIRKSGRVIASAHQGSATQTIRDVQKVREKSMTSKNVKIFSGTDQELRNHLIQSQCHRKPRKVLKQKGEYSK